MSGGNLLNRIKDQVNKAQNRQTNNNSLLFLDSQPDSTFSSSQSYRLNPNQIPSNTKNILNPLMGKTASYGSYGNMHSNDLFEDFNATAGSMSINRIANSNNPNKQYLSKHTDYAATIRHNNYMSFNNTMDSNDREDNNEDANLNNNVPSKKYRSKSQNQTAGSSVISSLKDAQQSMREVEQLEEAQRNESNRLSPSSGQTAMSGLFDKTALMRRQDKLKGISSVSVEQKNNNGRAYLKVNDMLEQQQQKQHQRREELQKQQQLYQYQMQETQVQNEQQLESTTEQQYKQQQLSSSSGFDSISEIICLIDTTIVQAANQRQSLLLEIRSVQSHNQHLKDQINTQQQNQTEMRELLQQKDQERRMAQAALRQVKEEIQQQQHQQQQQQQQQQEQQQKDTLKSEDIPRQPRKSSNTHAIPEDFSSLLRIIETLTEENKTLRNKNELLQYENDKAIELARRAKNNKAMSDLNNMIEFPSPLKNNQNQNTSGISNGLNDTFLRRKQILSNSNTSSNSKINHNNTDSNSNNNLMHGNLHNVSQIHQNQSPSLNTSTNDILKKLNLNDSSFSSNQGLSNTKKKFKYLQPKK